MDLREGTMKTERHNNSGDDDINNIIIIWGTMYIIDLAKKLMMQKHMLSPCSSIKFPYNFIT
jgi:hypothetical protein